MEAWCRSQHASRRGVHLRSTAAMHKAAGFQDAQDAAERQQEQLHQTGQDNARVLREVQRDEEDTALATSRSR
eukprot:2773580-Lingulodinium_polyedra.AAC.1